MTIIVTKRLQLKPLDLSDGHIREQVRWLNDPEVVRYSEQRHKKHSFYSQVAYLGHFNGSNNRFVEIHIGTKLIGTMTAYIDTENSVADVGILIGDKAQWGLGIGTEAWQAFCDVLLNTGIRKVEAGCMSRNKGMMGIAHNTGMVLEGRRFDHFLFNGELCDMCLWAKHSI